MTEDIRSVEFGPSQIACTVTTMYVHANGTTHVRKFVHHIDSCVKIIWICQCIFFLPCAWLPPPLVHRVVMLTPSLRCNDVCFYGCRFFSPVTNQTSLSQSKSWFLFILLCRREKYHWAGPLDLCINYTNMSWEQFMYSLKNYFNVISIG